MMIAGVPVRDDLVLELARMVDDDELADRLERCYRDEMKVMGLNVDEREAILVAIEDPPPGLEELRGVLLSDVVEWGRDRQGPGY